jgi:hypothetical protein
MNRKAPIRSVIFAEFALSPGSSKRLNNNSHSSSNSYSKPYSILPIFKETEVFCKTLTLDYNQSSSQHLSLVNRSNLNLRNHSDVLPLLLHQLQDRQVGFLV